MDIVTLEQFRDRLQAEKDRIETELDESHRFQMDYSETDSVGELSAYDNHPADMGSETFEREKDLALWNNTQERYHRVEEALQRVENGTYGRCDLCGQEIDMDRLEALPETSLCIACAENDERFVTRERPIEEEVLNPPFGRSFLDDTDYVATDGEDTWQEVAKYGTSESPSDLGGTDSYEDTFYNADEDQGVVEPVEGIINHRLGDEIPPDPANPDQRD